MKKPNKKAKTSSKRSSRFVRIQLSYVLDLGREFTSSMLPHEVVGLKDDVGGLILRGLVHSSTPFRVRYELGDIKLVPSSIVLKTSVVRGGLLESKVQRTRRYNKQTKRLRSKK